MSAVSTAFIYNYYIKGFLRFKIYYLNAHLYTSIFEIAGKYSVNHLLHKEFANVTKQNDLSNYIQKAY